MALLPIKSAQPHLVMLKPVLGKIHVRLVDKRNRVIHANRKYSLTGPLPLSGVTDERGELLHTGLPYADFVLGLELDVVLLVEVGAERQLRDFADRVGTLQHAASEHARDQAPARER